MTIAKEELTVVVLAIRKETINRKNEDFDEFIGRLREKYTKGLKTKRVTVQIVERKINAKTYSRRG